MSRLVRDNHVKKSAAYSYLNEAIYMLVAQVL